MIVNIVKQKLVNIEKGFKIIGHYADDCDEYGPLYFIECKNGWEGREHDLPEIIMKAIRKELVNIVDNGLRINGKLHFIDPRVIFSNKYLIEISEKDYLKNIMSKEYLTELKEKIKIGAKECNSVIFKTSGISIKEKTIEDLVSVYNPEMFKLTFWTIIMAYRTNNDFKESINQIIENQVYSIKKSLESIIKASNLTNKESLVLEYPNIET